MPVPQVSWTNGQPLTAKSLNLATYTYTPGNNHTPTGILFHTFPPMLSEIAYTALGFSQASTASGGSSETNLFANGKWQNIVDTAALFSIGADRAGSQGSCQYISRVPGSDGTAGTFGGWHLVWGFPMWSAQTNAGGAGALLARLNVSPGNTAFGGFQLATTTSNNCAYVLDFEQFAAPNSGYTLAGICADASLSSFAYTVSSNLSGTACRYCVLWGCSTLSGGQTAVGSLPAPQQTWSSTTAVTPTLINNSITNALQFLNVPPSLRVSTTLTTSIPATTTTVVPLTTPQLDSHAGFTSSTYTVPVTGVYLVHALVSLTNSSTNYCHAGVQINGTNYFGPAYTYTGGSSAVTRPLMTRLMDLQAGDTVKLITFSSASTTLSSSVGCRLILRWMSTTAASNSSVSFTQPDAWYRWQAGTAGSSLPSVFSSVVGNDINFLLQKPYLLAKQTVAQTGLTAGSWNALTMTTGGLVHNSAGDNYGGWVGPYYQAVVPGWYLAVLSAHQAAPSSIAVCTAGIGYYNSSGVAQGTTPDRYQSVSANNTTGPAGAEAIGLYYLKAGDRLEPFYQEVSGPTYSTTVATGHASTFGVVWVSE